MDVTINNKKITIEGSLRIDINSIHTNTDLNSVFEKIQPYATLQKCDNPFSKDYKSFTIGQNENRITIETSPTSVNIYGKIMCSKNDNSINTLFSLLNSIKQTKERNLKPNECGTVTIEKNPFA
jgi:hypothetical protein